jgi:hypothetical protein
MIAFAIVSESQDAEFCVFFWLEIKQFNWTVIYTRCGS